VRAIRRQDGTGRLSGSRPAFLTDEQEAEVRRLWACGYTRDEVCRALGIGVDVMRYRMLDQLSDLRRGRGAGGGPRVGGTRDPTPAEIRQRCAEIQALWTDEEREERWVGVPLSDFSGSARDP